MTIQTKRDPLLSAMPDLRFSSAMRTILHPLKLGPSCRLRFSCVLVAAVSILDCVSALAPVVMNPSLPQQRYKVVDERPIPGQTAGGLQPLNMSSSIQNLESVPCLFRIKVPITKPGDIVKIVGSTDSIGNWKPDKALALTTSKNDFPW
jgi:hypothetical protein